MFRQLNSQANTKQIKKTKLLESFRQNPTQRNKIMLTDLCLEQKARIGDLVKTLETRKTQNQILQQKIKQLQKKQKTYIQKIDQLKNIIQQNKNTEKKLKQQLKLSKIKQQQKQRYIQHLQNEKQQAKLFSNRNIKACVQQFALTDPIITLNQGIQVNPKKKKCKEQQVQTQIIQQGRKYPNNSKSFQKIMKIRSTSQSGQKIKNKKPEKSKRSAIVINDQEHNSNSQQAQQINSQNQEQEFRKVQLQEDQDSDFNQLAKKWLQLKQKNMSKIKQSYNKSKQKVRSSSNKAKKVSRTIGVPRQFDQKNIIQQDQQGGSYAEIDNQYNDFQHNQSFGPKKSSKYNYKKNEEAGDQDFDQIQLNRILKSKNFSASRLLSKNRINSQQSQRQASRQYDRGRYEQKNSVNERKGKKPSVLQPQNYLNSNYTNNTPNMKISGVSNSRSNYNNTNNIDFYETDLLDIVSSINRK